MDLLCTKYLKALVGCASLQRTEHLPYPGNLPDGWTVEMLLIKRRSIPANPDIANVLSRAVSPVATVWTEKPRGGDTCEVGATAQGVAIGIAAANTQEIVPEYGMVTYHPLRRRTRVLLNISKLSVKEHYCSQATVSKWLCLRTFTIRSVSSPVNEVRRRIFA